MPTEKAMNSVFKSRLFCLMLDASKGPSFSSLRERVPHWKRQEEQEVARQSSQGLEFHSSFNQSSAA